MRRTRRKDWGVPGFHPEPPHFNSVRMTSLNSIDSAVEPGATKAPAFHILIVSENDQIAARAIHVCDHLMARFDESFVYQIAMATFSALERPAAFEESLNASATADMIFVVSDSGLPQTITEWLNACVRNHEDVPFAITDMTKQGLIDAVPLREGSGLDSRGYGVDVIRQQPRWISPFAPSNTSSRGVSQCCSRRWDINE